MARDSQHGNRASRNGNGPSASRGRNDARRGSRTPDRTPRQQSRRGTLKQPDTGYRLHSRRVSYPNGNGGFVSMLLRPRVLLLIGILVIVIVALVLGISSCVRGNKERAAQTVEETKPVNQQDKRVAAGVPSNMTSKFTEALDENELLAQIAATADQYDDERLLNLALREPASRKFVAAYPSSDKSSRPYTGEVKRGTVPTLYDWDERWGAVTYGDGPLAVTGSGPTTLAMAYMGLTGKTDYSPTEIAQQASKNNYASGDSGSKGELFAKGTTSMGLKAEQHEPASETLLFTLNENTVFAVELKANTLTDEAHWALVVSIDENSMLKVFDPTSTLVTNTTWGLDTITGASNTFYSITLSEEAFAALEKSTTTGTDATGTGTDTTTGLDGTGTTGTGATDTTGTGTTSTTTGTDTTGMDSTGTTTGTDTTVTTGTGTTTSTGTDTTGTGTTTSTGTDTTGTDTTGTTNYGY